MLFVRLCGPPAALPAAGAEGADEGGAPTGGAAADVAADPIVPEFGVTLLAGRIGMPPAAPIGAPAAAGPERADVGRSEARALEAVSDELCWVLTDTRLDEAAAAAVED